MARRPSVALAVPALLTTLALATLPAHAASSASSASSEGSSASSGSVSDSFESSSDSSKGDKVAEGDYRLIQVAAAEQPGKLRLTLEGTGGAKGTFVLLVPEVTVQQAALALGDTVTARSRNYGWEFAAAATQQPFFLVVHDAQKREFATRKVTL
jgi:hypothetical protein